MLKIKCCNIKALRKIKVLHALNENSSFLNVIKKGLNIKALRKIKKSSLNDSSFLNVEKRIKAASC